MKTIGTTLMLAATLLCSAQGNEPPPLNGVFFPGEELCYKVKWKFVRLGTIVVRTVRDSSTPNPSDIKIIMTVQSNPDLPFVWIREYNESLFDAVALTSRSFRARHRNGNDYYAVQQVRNDTLHTMTYTRTDLNTKATVCCDTLRDIGNYTEGPSLFFYARCMSRTAGSRNVPTLIDGKMRSTGMSVDGSVEEVNLDAWESGVRTRLLTGFAHWTGGSSAGVSGEFRAWMSDDEAAVPVRAELKILLGSIDLELEKWTRTGWTPPTPHTSLVTNHTGE